MSGSTNGSSPRNALDPFQQELLEAFFAREQRFFLTDGAAATDLGAPLEALRTSPSFHRFLATRGSQSVIVDLVEDSAPQLEPKLRYGSIRVDSAREILANKLCTLLSRAELRDLVDVRALEEAGYRVEDALEPAARKDGGLTAGQLAWVLSELEIGEDAQPPGVSASELREYLERLVGRLTLLAFPSE